MTSAPAKAWQTLIGYANGDLSALVFERDASIPGDNPTRQSKLLKYLQADSLHRDVGLTRDDMLRLAAWMDTYGQTQGAFSPEQEKQLTVLREELRQLFESPSARNCIPLNEDYSSAGPAIRSPSC